MHKNLRLTAFHLNFSQPTKYFLAQMFDGALLRAIKQLMPRFRTDLNFFLFFYLNWFSS